MHVIDGKDIHTDARIEADALVIGSGAGGATAAKLLAEAGLDVVVIEEGAHRRSEDFHGSIPHLMHELYRDGGLTPIYGKPNIAFAEGCCLGGSTTINGALCWRTPPHILRQWREQGLPAMGDDDLDHIFAAIENDLSISVQDTISGNSISRRLEAGSEELGWAWEPVPRAQRDCRNSNRCPTGCPTGAKQSMLVTYLPQAAQQGARLYTNARAHALQRDGDRVSHVIAKVGPAGERTLTIKARDVFMACGTVQTPWLLRRNKIGAHVGKTLGIHFNCKAVADFGEDISPAPGTMMTAQVKEFADQDFYLGGSNFDPTYLAVTLAQHGRDTVAAMVRHWNRCAVYLSQVKCSGLGRIVDSRMGRPLPLYTLTREDETAIRDSMLRLAELLFAAGASAIYLPLSGSGRLDSLAKAHALLDAGFDTARLDVLSVHAMSACRMGADGAAAACDGFGRLQGMRNVHLCDASILPGPTGVNPQVTIMALVYRNILHYLDNRG